MNRLVAQILAVELPVGRSVGVVVVDLSSSMIVSSDANSLKQRSDGKKNHCDTRKQSYSRLVVVVAQSRYKEERAGNSDNYCGQNVEPTVESNGTKTTQKHENVVQTTQQEESGENINQCRFLLLTFIQVYYIMKDSRKSNLIWF